MIRSSTPSPLVIAAIAILAIVAISPSSLGKENSVSGTGLAKADIGQSVYAIDNLADQMSFRYAWELRYNSGCKDSLALLRRIQKHTSLTNDLVRAYRGKCQTTFQTAAEAVRESVAAIDDLQLRARVSEGVSRLIDQSVPLASGIQNSSSNFLPTQVLKHHDSDIYRRRG